ncbi:MAG: hypothetical protein ACJAZO_001360 [Myxococcota bacterium]|jgi:uncharacterized protein with von Willebrand factor type A (vWA) domain
MNATDIVQQHPLVRDLGEDDAEQRRIGRFAQDLARWLVGDDAWLSPLARVVVLVADRELSDARRLCHNRPLLAVEAAARAVAALWPLLRISWEVQDTKDGDDTEEVDAWLENVGAGGEDDPELRELALRLTQPGGDAVQSAADAGRPLAQAARAAEDGAIDGNDLVERLESFLPGVGWSTAPGSLEPALVADLDRLATLLQSLDALQDIAERLGRIDGETDLGEGGSEEVAGVHLSGDVSSALPAELAMLADPDTEDLFYQRLTEHRLLSLELSGQGIDGVGDGDKRGPVIACVDTSGSMRGRPEHIAKALVLAVCRQALPQGRTIHLLLFSGPDDRTEARIRAGRGGLEALLSFLTQSFGGGTDFDAPLIRALELLEEQALERADILVVTDGLARAEDDVIARVAQARESLGVRVVSVVIGRDTAGVDAFSDEVRLLSPDALGNDPPA